MALVMANFGLSSNMPASTSSANCRSKSAVLLQSTKLRINGIDLYLNCVRSQILRLLRQNIGLQWLFLHRPTAGEC